MNAKQFADRAHEAILALKAEDANGILNAALKKWPNDPDLICEQAILDCFLQRENVAARAISQTDGAARRDELVRILRDHFHCLAKLETQNVEARHWLDRLTSLCSEPLDHVGVQVSAILIVKNEEQRLATCLSSLKGFADQIVVVDTGSTDRTVEIAKSFGATMGEFAWCNDYSAARNESLRLATGHWALWIDADEELDAGAIQSLRRAITRPHFGGYFTEIVNYTDDGDNSNEFVHNAIRLFRNVPGIQFSERIHEQVGPSLSALGMVWATIEGPCFRHHGYRPSEIAAKGKLEKTIAMLEQVVRDQPNDPFQWFNLANSHLIAGRFPEAAHGAEMCVSLLKSEKDYAPLAYQIWANALGSIGEVEPCLAVCAKADAAGYGGILNEFERASILAKASRFDEALAAIDRCLAAPWPKSKPGDRGIFTHKRYIIRGQILSAMGRFDEAQRMLDIALNVIVDEPTAVYWKAVTYERKGDLVQAKAWYKRGFKDPQIAELCEQGVARCLAAQGSGGEVQTECREAWEADRTNIEKWALWLQACEANNDRAEIFEAYESLAAAIEPTSAILVNWGRALESVGELTKALNCYTEAIQRNPDDANAYFNCGDLLYRTGSFLDAAHLYEAGLRRDPENAEAWFTLGNSLAQLNLIDGAMTSYRQTLARNPMHYGAQQNMLTLSSELGQAQAA